jgi:hypothetical protein
VRPWCETSMHYFSCSGGTGADYVIKPIGTRYGELVFLHLVGSAGRVVNTGASEA